MNCEVAYLSNSAAMLAEEIVDALSAEQVHLTDLSCESASAGADIYLIGFDINRGTIPMKIMDTLDAAEGKTILLFVTSGMEPTEEYKAAVERKIQPFLPDDCDYRGLFLCAAQFPDEVVQNMREVLRRDPENARAKSLMEHYQKTCGHPDVKDLADLRKFVREKLIG